MTLSLFWFFLLPSFFLLFAFSLFKCETTAVRLERLPNGFVVFNTDNEVILTIFDKIGGTAYDVFVARDS